MKYDAIVKIFTLNTQGGMSMHTTNTICSIFCIQAHRLSPENLAFHRERMGQLIERELREAINDGMYEFRVGMNMGADIWAAERIIALRDKQFPHIRLHCYLPCETQANHWPETWREAYFNCLAVADQVFFLQRRYSKGCVQRRTREMIAGSARLIALHDNVIEGRVERALGSAAALGVECYVVYPLEGPPVHASKAFYMQAVQSSAKSSQMSSAYSTRFSMGKSAIKRAW